MKKNQLNPNQATAQIQQEVKEGLVENPGETELSFALFIAYLFIYLLV